jgi:protein-disulfide isomerase
LRVAVLSGLLVGGISGISAQAPAQSLVVTSAVPDAAAGTVTISGEYFGARPFVTLDLVPLDVRVAMATVILAAVPAGTIPPGEYLLTVSRGPGPGDSATLEITVGTAESPAAPRKADQRRDGELRSQLTADRNTSALPPVVAGDSAAMKIGDRVVSVEEVDREWSRSDPAGYLRLLRGLHDARMQIANKMISQELLSREAAARGIAVEALLAEELPKRAIPMPESAVVSLYQSLGAGTRGAALDQMRPALRAWLARRTEPEIAKTSFIEELNKVSTRAEILLDAPRVLVERSPEDLALGPGTAVVDIAVFADFQNAEYARLARAFSKVRETFGDRVRLVFRNRPTLDAASVAAAEAALCANAQDRFWPYHDALVGAGGIGIQEAAAKAGLNSERFTSCVERRDFKDAIGRATAEADRYGIDAIPSVLINGRLAPSPPAFLTPYDYFKLLIEEELGRVAAAARKH